MKKKKRNFITKIFSLLLLGIISVTLLGSWTYNPTTDTITSDNLCNLDGFNASGGITKNDDTINVPSGLDIAWYGQIFQVTLEPNTYTINFYSNVTSGNTGRIQLNDSPVNHDLGNIYVSYGINGAQGFFSNKSTFTLEQSTTLYARYVLDVDYNGVVLNNNATSTAFSFKVMLNVGSNAKPYEPYGTYVNQQRLDDLELDYDDLAEQYSNLYDEKEQLQQQYDSLNTAYEQLEINYNRAIDDLDQLRDEKQELQQQLADLNAELNLLRPYIFNNSDIVVKIGNSTVTGDNFVATSIVSNVSSYFDNYGSFDLDSLYSNYSGFGSTYNAICFEVPNYNLMMYNVSFSFTGYPDMLYRLNYQDSVGNNLVVARDFTESYTDLYGFSIVSGLRNSSMWDSSQPIEYCTYSKIVFVGLNIGALNVKNLNFSSSSGYSEGFNQGYNSIKNTTDTIITRLNNQIDSLNTTIDNLHNQITDLQNQLNNSVGWRPLFFAMADTPLKVVSNVLGFELFGLNLFQAFIGIITALAIIWLIRKIWK